MTTTVYECIYCGEAVTMAWFCPEFSDKGQRCELLDDHTGAHEFPQLYECIYCDFWTEDEQDYNRHMLDHQEAVEEEKCRCELCERGLDHDSEADWDQVWGTQDDQPPIPFMWDGKIVQ